jgi:hypothetical protein
MGKQRKLVEAVAYLRTSSSTNAGPDKDSDKRQRAAITAFAKAQGYVIVDEFYDAAVSGADPIAERPGFRRMLDRIAGNGVRCIIVESPDRFARDLTVQLTGHDPQVAGHCAHTRDRAGLLHGGHANRGAGASGARRHRAIREDVLGRLPFFAPKLPSNRAHRDGTGFREQIRSSDVAE